MSAPTLREIDAVLFRLAHEFPPQQVDLHLRQQDRIAFEISVVVKAKGVNCRICDVGGGLCLFSVGCAALGMSSVLVDDSGDPINKVLGDSALDVHRRYGVEVIQRDVIQEGLDFPHDSFDVVTSFDCIEHLHHSPKRLLHKIVEILKPGGIFILGAPNCVHLRKRLTVPLGYGKWSLMSDWYEQERFRAHVREPDVDDLRYIARDMGLTDVRIMGRNWAGYHSKRPWVRFLTPLADLPLRLFPSLCSHIYMMGTKP
jgi:SAM-dependent methyltransferase